ncbi:MAG TPA: HEAT repeat domain-containing protein [Blastocatellia bacterium]|nr:HEAT repeat domain-containing protein [Blastocatellia bacterium]
MNRSRFAKILIVAMVFAAIGLTPLTALGDEQSVDTLVTYMKSPLVPVRRDAAHKLGERRVKDQAAVQALAEAAQHDEDEGVRADSIHALGRIKDFSALDAMLGGLKDSDPAVRRAAIKALVMLYTEHDIDFITNRRTGWNLLNPLLDTDDHEVIGRYVMVEPAIIAGLGEAASSDRVRDNRISAIRALGVLHGAEAIPQLGDALTSDREVRIDVIRTFIKIGEPEAGRFLIPFFRDSDQKVRTQAMFAAGMLKYHPAAEPLLSIYGLGSDKKGPIGIVTQKIKGRFEYLPPRDEAALWALSLIGDPQAEQIFVENLDDKDGDRRQYAVEGLARIREPRYKDQISRMLLTEHNGDAKLAEHWALYKMGDHGELQQVIRKLDSLQAEQATQYALEVNSPSDLYPYVDASNKTIRLAAIGILGRVGDQESIGVLKPVLAASGQATADAATEAIKTIEWRLWGKASAEDSSQTGQGGTRPRRVSSP